MSDSSITGLQVISNLYASKIMFINTENSGNNREADSLETKNTGDAWIPWCDSKEVFAGHHMRVEGDGLKIYLWQSGPTIRYSHEGWSADAPSIPGNAKVGQRVAWVLDASGKITQTHYS